MDTTKLTLGEVAKVEQLAGVSIDSIMESGTPKGKAIAALVFVIQKRTNPNFTFDDALNMDMETAMNLIGVEEVEDDEDPKDVK